MASKPAPAPKGDAPLFRFMQINDTHVHAGRGAYSKVNDKFRWLVEAADSSAYFPRPDFLIGVGDLIEGGTLEDLAPDTRLLLEMLKPLHVPLYPVMGNHEVVQREGDPKFEQAYREAFGNERVNYTFMHGGVMFIALNNGGAGCAIEPAVIKARNEWLRQELEHNKDVPKIIFCHVPLVPLREEKVFVKSFGFRNDYDRDGGTLSVIERHADTVIAVLSGHFHLTGMAQKSGIFHISISGTASYPCDYALYTAFPDRIEVAVRQIPPELVTRNTDIHGKPRHPVDYVDENHKTHEEYVSGRPEERDFTIPLTGRKRPNRE